MRDRNIKRESNPAVLFIDEEHKVMSFHAWSVKRIYTGVQILSSEEPSFAHRYLSEEKTCIFSYRFLVLCTPTW
jgi:hypothetical protein